MTSKCKILHLVTQSAEKTKFFLPRFFRTIVTLYSKQPRGDDSCVKCIAFKRIRYFSNIFHLVDSQIKDIIKIIASVLKEPTNINGVLSYFDQFPSITTHIWQVHMHSVLQIYIHTICFINQGMVCACHNPHSLFRPQSHDVNVFIQNPKILPYCRFQLIIGLTPVRSQRISQIKVYEYRGVGYTVRRKRIFGQR